MQIMTPMIPSLQALSREGEQGRNQIQLYTHWMAVPMAVVQGYSQLLILQRAGAVTGIGFTGADALPTLAAVISMTAGTMFLVWLGELITEKGIGNGISLIIFGGIVAGIPSLLPQIFDSSVSFFGIFLLAIIVLVAVSSIVFFQEAQRRVPVQYSRTQFRGGRQYRQQGSTHIPLRVLSAGMIPIIFAYSIMLVPVVHRRDAGDFERRLLERRRQPPDRRVRRSETCRTTSSSSCSWCCSPSSTRW